MNLITESFDYISAQSTASILSLFALVIIFEIPRYLALFLVAAFFERPRQQPLDVSFRRSVAVIVAGHNEAESFPRCVDSLMEQSRPPDQIIAFSDGSTDGTPQVLRDLLAKGKIHNAMWTDLRGGKSAGFNICQRMATCDLIVNIDCDCSLDRDAIRRIVEPFDDPEIGGVAGNIQVRNADASLIAACQAIEYMITISLGKQAALVFDQVTCASGGYSAFRRSALEQIGGNDAGGGEDLDATLRLRAYGWKIGFRSDSVCYTDVPDTVAALVRQRFRWERDAVRLRFRKYSYAMNPFHPQFRVSELAHQLEFLIFNILGASILPFYIVWLFYQFGSHAFVILLSVKILLMIIDFYVFILAAMCTPHVNSLKLFPFILAYNFYNGLFMRCVRLAAYVDEWIFKSSYKDSYVPQKVHDVRGG